MKFTLQALFSFGLIACVAGCDNSGQSTPATGASAGGASRGSTKEQSSASAPAGDQNHKRYTVALLPKKKGVPYFTTCAKGAEEAAKELGIDLIYDGPTDGAPEKAAAMIERWTLQSVNCIAVSPNDPDVLAPAMKKAREKGVQVITWDADGAPGTRSFFVNQATSQAIGYALVDQLAHDLGLPPVPQDTVATPDAGAAPADPFEVAIITATLTAANQNEWIKHMKNRLAAYPRLKFVALKPSNEDQKLAFQTTQDLMKAYPKLAGIFAISSVAFPGAAEAVKQAGKAGAVQVIGLSTPNDMRAYLMDGTVRSVILWNTVDLGYLTIQTAGALLGNKLKEGATSLSAGRLGAKRVAGDNVLLGDILVFTKENVGKFDF